MENISAMSKHSFYFYAYAPKLSDDTMHVYNVAELISRTIAFISCQDLLYYKQNIWSTIKMVKERRKSKLKINKKKEINFTYSADR